jgi:hypothetical protein
VRVADDIQLQLQRGWHYVVPSNPDRRR